MSAVLQPRILLVDDDVHVLDALQRQLRRQFDVTATSDAKEAIRLVVAEGPFAVVVSDLRMPGMDGVSLLYLIRQSAPETVRVLLTGDADMEAAISAINQGNIFRFLTKPCSPATLIRTLEASVEQYRSCTGCVRLDVGREGEHHAPAPKYPRDSPHPGVASPQEPSAKPPRQGEST